MEVVNILRALWRRRALIAVGAILAIGVGALASQGSKEVVGLASTRVVIDTPRSQLVDPAPRGADTLSGRAALLADLASTERSTARIARAADVSPGELLVANPQLSVPTLPTPLPEKAAPAAASVREPHVVLLRWDEALPIVTIDTRAPDARRAESLSVAAVAELERLAQPADARDTDGLAVETLAPVRAHEVVRGPRRAMALAAALIVLTLWCGALIVVPGIAGATARSVRPVQPVA